ncbi:hypothetical protein GQ53DRAFT_773460 [Thozetella sp. PMI_491]|nr:hypothetical protein GQ53DRAFT_773460 [Thozetella sp. PMI_491]
MHSPRTGLMVVALAGALPFAVAQGDNLRFDASEVPAACSTICQPVVQLVAACNGPQTAPAASVVAGPGAPGAGQNAAGPAAADRPGKKNNSGSPGAAAQQPSRGPDAAAQGPAGPADGPGAGPQGKSAKRSAAIRAVRRDAQAQSSREGEVQRPWSQGSLCRPRQLLLVKVLGPVLGPVLDRQPQQLPQLPVRALLHLLALHPAPQPVLQQVLVLLPALPLLRGLLLPRVALLGLLQRRSLASLDHPHLLAQVWVPQLPRASLAHRLGLQHR